MQVRKIVSGGQTGADRAALDFAMNIGIEIGGYIPKGRLAEDGILPQKYANLTETKTTDPSERTRLNVMHSDGTIIFSQGELIGGSLLTQQIAIEVSKPFVHIDLSIWSEDQASEIAAVWIKKNKLGILNIAGSRASEDPLIYSKVQHILRRLFAG